MQVQIGIVITVADDRRPTAIRQPDNIRLAEGVTEFRGTRILINAEQRLQQCIDQIRHSGQQWQIEQNICHAQQIRNEGQHGTGNRQQKVGQIGHQRADHVQRPENRLAQRLDGTVDDALDQRGVQHFAQDVVQTVGQQTLQQEFRAGHDPEQTATRGVGKFPEHDLFRQCLLLGECIRGDEGLGIGDIQGVDTLSAAPQTADQDGPPAGLTHSAGRKLVVGVDHAHPAIDVSLGLVVRIGQFRDLAQQTPRHVGEQLLARRRVEAMQHAVVGADIDHGTAIRVVRAEGAVQLGIRRVPAKQVVEELVRIVGIRRADDHRSGMVDRPHAQVAVAESPAVAFLVRLIATQIIDAPLRQLPGQAQQAVEVKLVQIKRRNRRIHEVIQTELAERRHRQDRVEDLLLNRFDHAFEDRALDGQHDIDDGIGELHQNFQCQVELRRKLQCGHRGQAIVGVAELLPGKRHPFAQGGVVGQDQTIRMPLRIDLLVQQLGRAPGRLAQRPVQIEVVSDQVPGQFLGVVGREKHALVVQDGAGGDADRRRALGISG